MKQKDFVNFCTIVLSFDYLYDGDHTLHFRVSAHSENGAFGDGKIWHRFYRLVLYTFARSDM